MIRSPNRFISVLIIFIGTIHPNRIGIVSMGCYSTMIICVLDHERDAKRLVTRKVSIEPS
jgi:hypothetical protein